MTLFLSGFAIGFAAMPCWRRARWFLAGVPLWISRARVRLACTRRGHDWRKLGDYDNGSNYECMRCQKQWFCWR